MPTIDYKEQKEIRYTQNGDPSENPGNYLNALSHDVASGNVWIWSGSGGAWYKQVDRGRVLSTDPMLDVSAGVYDFQSAVNKFGKALDVDTATETDIWDGADGTTSTDVWVPPTIARVHNIASTDANDASGSGTGARTVEVQGLDTNWDLQQETVNMNGVTDVPTSGSYRRIFRMKVVTAGNLGGNAGIVTATAVTDATVTAAIQPGNNQSLMAIYTVPNGKTAYITSYYSSFSGSTPATVSGNVRLLVKNVNASNTVFQLKHILGLIGGQGFQHEFAPYYKVTEKHDIKLNMNDSSANNTALTGGFDIVLVNN